MTARNSELSFGFNKDQLDSLPQAQKDFTTGDALFGQPVSVKKGGRKKVEKECRNNFHGGLLTTCPIHPKAANRHDVRACIYCLQTYRGKLYKDKQRAPIVSLNLKGNSKEFPRSIEDGQTLKTEAAGADASKVCNVFISVLKLIIIYICRATRKSYTLVMTQSGQRQRF